MWPIMRRLRANSGLVFGTIVLPAALAVALAQSAAQAEPRGLHIVTGDDYPPFVDRELEHGGWVTELVRTALEDAGFTITTFQWLPWKRGLEDTRAGRTDGTYPRGYTADRANEVLYSEPIFFNSAFAWVRRDSILTVAELGEQPFCLPLGYVEFGRTKEIVDVWPNSRVSVPNMTQCFRMLDATRVDVVISTENDVRSAMAIAELSPNAFSALEPAMHRIGYHFVVAKDRPGAQAIIAAVNAGIAKRNKPKTAR